MCISERATTHQPRQQVTPRRHARHAVSSPLAKSHWVTTTNMATADKRIPVTEERWKELNNLKEPGQSYDELLEVLVEEHKKAQLKRHIEDLRAEQEEFTRLDEV